MMGAQTREPLWRATLALAGCLWLSACGSPSALFRTGHTAPPFLDPLMSMQAAQDAVVAGQTTQALAMATLGPATEIQFDSGYTVWVYRARAGESQASRAELVILFAPSGVVKKTRLRPSYAGQAVEK